MAAAWKLLLTQLRCTLKHEFYAIRNLQTYFANIFAKTKSRVSVSFTFLSLMKLFMFWRSSRWSKMDENISSPLNSTEHGQSSSNIIWTLSLPFDLFLIATTLWMTLTFMVFGESYLRRKKEEKKEYSPGKVLIFSMISPPFALIRLMVTFSLFFIGHKDTPQNRFLCEIVIDVSIASYMFSLIPFYLFLWFRQRVLYSQPFIRNLYTRWIKCLSSAIIICLIFGGIGSVILYLLPETYAGSPKGCVNVSNMRYNTPDYMATALRVIGQAILLLLFLYPLLVHRKFQTSVFRGSKRKTTPGGDNVPEDPLLRTMLRSLCCTLASVLVDLAATISVSVLPKNVPRVLTNLIYDISLVLNVIFIALCFEGHKAIFSALCQVRKCPNVTTCAEVHASHSLISNKKVINAWCVTLCERLRYLKLESL